ncbi:MAG: hypothetical protein VB110_09510 [Bacteroidales bacterium]|nr:hypothetical protein [Bacteroidales bacterium]
MKILKKILVTSLLTIVASTYVSAQDSTGMISYQDFEQLQSDNALAKKIKISGYVQMQYQKADTAGISNYDGGNFASGVDNRMMVRRGRVKFAYDNEGAQAVMQFDITEKGVGIKHAYLSVTEPWINAISLTGGVFDRPFGYEISYSSSSRESPERSRIFQTLFPGERDLGASLTLQAPKTSTWNFLKLGLGLFNGNGIAVETDSYKDFIGHLSATKSSSDEKIMWGLGASYYDGGFAATTNKTYSINDVNGVKAFTALDSKVGDRTKRQYFGIDGQVSYDWVMGITQIRAEYLAGTQPGFASSSSSLTAAATGNVFNRKFNGFYVYFVQNILETPLQAVVKYDVYDPNTEVSGNEIGKAVAGATTTNATDAKFSTLGLGLNYRFNSNVKVMAYYDMVANEKTSNIVNSSTLTDLSHDRKDNVLTLRIQYKF